MGINHKINLVTNKEEICFFFFAEPFIIRVKGETVHFGWQKKDRKDIGYGERSCGNSLREV